MFKLIKIAIILDWLFAPFAWLMRAIREWNIRRIAVRDERRHVAKESAEKQAEYAEDAKNSRGRVGRMSDSELNKRLSKWRHRP